MKYFSTLLVLIATIISVKGKIPDYIQTCKQSDPQLNQCVQNSILSLRNKLVAGIPKLDVPPIDPLHLDQLVVNLGPGFKAEGRNLLLTGGKDFEIHDLVVDVASNTYTFVVKIPEISATGDYVIDAKLGQLPIKGNGAISLVAKSVTGRGTIHGKKVVRSGKALYYFPNMSMNIDVADYTLKLENLSEGDPVIGEVTNKVLNEEKKEVLASLLPGLEKALIEHILGSANNIVKHFTWEELFVER